MLLKLLVPLTSLLVTTNGCGVAPIPPVLDDQVDYGRLVKPFSWPWQAALYGTRTGEVLPKFLCGASIVGPKWLLTAAHCLLDNDPKFVRAGIFDRKMEDTDEQQAVIKSSYKHRYEAFSVENLIYDIALIEVEEPFIFTNHVQPICLTRNDENATRLGQRLWKAGWGHLRDPIEDEPKPSRLHQTNPVVNSYSDFPEECVTRENTIIAGDPRQGACYGDSGSALVKQTDTRWFQYGIIARGTLFSPGCGQVACTKVSFYCDWINVTTRGEVQCDRFANATTNLARNSKTFRQRFANVDTKIDNETFIGRLWKGVKCFFIACES